MSDAIFICKDCGRVYPEPQDGHRSGFTVRQIKQAFRDSPTIADVNDTAKQFGFYVALLARSGGEAATMATQIRNLAGYRRNQLGGGFGKAA